MNSSIGSYNLNLYEAFWSLYFCINIEGRKNKAIGIATGYGLDDRGVGVRVPVGSRIFSSPRCPPNLLSNGYEIFPRG
jgi:hypothetical protein